MDQAVIMTVIILTGGVLITPLGILFVMHRKHWAFRRRHSQHRRR